MTWKFHRLQAKDFPKAPIRDLLLAHHLEIHGKATLRITEINDAFAKAEVIEVAGLRKQHESTIGHGTPVRLRADTPFVKRASPELCEALADAKVGTLLFLVTERSQTTMLPQFILTNVVHPEGT